MFRIPYPTNPTTLKAESSAPSSELPPSRFSYLLKNPLFNAFLTEKFDPKSETPSLLPYIQFVQCFETGEGENKVSDVISNLFSLLRAPASSDGASSDSASSDTHDEAEHPPEQSLNINRMKGGVNREFREEEESNPKLTNTADPACT